MSIKLPNPNLLTTPRRSPVLALVLVFVLGCVFPAQARAGKGTLALGWYDLITGTQSLYSLGLARIGYLHPVTPKLDIGLGYTFMTSGTFSGDIGFGFDLGAYYYPVSESAPVKNISSSYQLDIRETFRPFVGMAAVQKIFQAGRTASSANYFGFGLIGGTDYSISQSFDLRGELRYSRFFLSGSSDSLSEIDLFLGVSLAIF